MGTNSSFEASRSRSARRVAVATILLATSGAIVAACSDDAGDRTNGGGEDAGGDSANVPDTAAPFDASQPDAKLPYEWQDVDVVCTKEPGRCAKELTAGEGHFCARMADGTVRCWGKNDLGNLGLGSTPDPDAGSSPIGLVRGLTGVAQISASENTTCARLAGGAVRCWGGNKNAELALTADPSSGDRDPHPDPVAPAGVDGVARIEVGPTAVCAQLTSGRLTCWGRNATGQLAREIPQYPPNLGPGEAQIDPIAVKEVHVGSNSTFALDESGGLFVWGALAGQEGFCSGVVAALSPSLSPHKVLLPKVTSFGVSLHFQPPSPPPPPGERPGPPFPQEGHACAITNGEVYCWGRSDKAALCTGLPDPEKVPRRSRLKSNAWPQRVAVGHEITCVRMTDGTVQCCGSNDKGRLGAPQTTTHAASFTPVATFKDHAVQVATSNAAVCALLQGGAVQCWGGNVYGELGTGAADSAAHPEPREIAF